MAPLGGKSSDRNQRNQSMDNGDADNLWANVLTEVQTRSSSKLPSNKSLLVLGDNESGKTTLLAKLQGLEDPRKGAGLEYHYIDVKDEYRDDNTRLGVWILDGERHHSNLLRFALSEKNFADTLVLLVVSMATPWLIPEVLNKWSALLQDHISRLKMNRGLLQEYEESLVRHFQEYVEPEEGSSQTTQTSTRRNDNPLHPRAVVDEERVLLPLGETTLTNNLGIPLVVVITKTDAISSLEKEHDFREEHFDFIQQHIRKFCLNYGAALVSTSVKEEKNCDLLYKYIAHRIYGLPFNTGAYVVEKDSVFIPAGWDNDKKISILYENMTSMKPEDAYEDVICKPVTRKPVQRDTELLFEDEQVFLMKQQTQLSKQPAPGARSEVSPMRATTIQKPSTSPRVPGTAGGASMVGTPKKPIGEAGKNAQTSEGVLANFFNSLLSKKTGAPGQPGVPGSSPKPAAGGDRVSRDAAAELDRMTRVKKTSTQQNSTTNNSS